MKYILLFCSLLMLGFVANSQKVKKFYQKKKVGLNLIQDNVSKLLIPATYQKSRGTNTGYFLYNSDKKGDLANGIFVSMDGSYKKEFTRVDKADNRYVVYKTEKGTHLFSFDDREILFEGQDEIEFRYMSKNHPHTFVLHKGTLSKVIFQNEEILSIPRTSIKIDKTLGLLSTGNEIKALYNFRGEKVIEGIADYKLYLKNWKEKTTLIKVLYEDEEQALLKNNQVILSKAKGCFCGELVNKDRIVFRTDKGHKVYNENGERIGDKLYEDILPFPVSDPKRPFLPNFAKTNGKWILLDHDLKQIGTDSYEYLDVLNPDDFRRKDWHYVVKKNLTDIGYMVLDPNGKIILEDAADGFLQINDYHPIIIARKDKKYAIANSFGNSGFVYDKIYEGQGENYLDKNSFACQKGKFQVLYQAGESHKEYFSNDELTSLKQFYFGEEEFYTPYWLMYKNKQFSIALESVQSNQVEFTQIGNFKFTDYELDESYDFLDFPSIKLYQNGKCGLYNAVTLDTLIPNKYTDILIVYENMDMFNSVNVYNGKKMGLCRINGKERIPPIYDEIFMYNDYAVVKTNGKYGMYNYQMTDLLIDTILLKPYDDEIEPSRTVSANNGVTDQECYLLDDKKMICFDEIEAYSTLDVFKVKKGNMYGLINNHSDTVLSIAYNSIEKYPQDFDGLVLKKGKKYSLYNVMDEEIVYADVDEINYISKLNIDVVRKGSLWGTFEFGEKVLPIAYEEIVHYKDFLLLRKNNTWTASDTNGVEVSDQKYDTKKELLTGLKKR